MTVACRSMLALLVCAGVASAQDNTKAADAAFKQGRELYKQNKYAEACEQFEKSQALDPANGTLFNIAQCSEKIGKLALAVLGCLYLGHASLALDALLRGTLSVFGLLLALLELGIALLVFAGLGNMLKRDSWNECRRWS